MILRIHRGGVSTLLTGGAGGRVEQEFHALPIETAADVWVIGNQGRDGVVSEAGLASIQPRAVVLAVGAFNRYGYPEDDVLQRLVAREDLPVWRTDESGSIDIELSSRTRFGRRMDKWRVRSEWASNAE